MINRRLGLIALALSLVIIFIWIPLDVESGLIEKVRRSVTLGDAFAPTIAASLIGLGGVLILLSLSSTSTLATSAPSDTMSLRAHTYHALAVLLIVCINLIIMRYAGPLAVSTLHNNNAEYRLLRDTIPWKYIGYISGGTLLVAGLIAWTERRLRLTHILIGITATLLFIVFYDLPFDDLLLPPNGDV